MYGSGVNGCTIGRRDWSAQKFVGPMSISQRIRQPHIRYCILGLGALLLLTLILTSHRPLVAQPSFPTAPASPPLRQPIGATPTATTTAVAPSPLARATPTIELPVTPPDNRAEVTATARSTPQAVRIQGKLSVVSHMAGVGLTERKFDYDALIMPTDDNRDSLRRIIRLSSQSAGDESPDYALIELGQATLWISREAGWRYDRDAGGSSLATAMQPIFDLATIAQKVCLENFSLDTNERCVLDDDPFISSFFSDRWPLAASCGAHWQTRSP